MPSLRGHHLICLHFFNGDGYDPDFIENLAFTLKTAEETDVHIRSGADDICRACPCLQQDTCAHHEHAEQEIRNMDETALGLLHLSTGNDKGWDEIRKDLPRIFVKWYGSFCRDCGWLEACGKNGLFQRLRANAEQLHPVPEGPSAPQ